MAGPGERGPFLRLSLFEGPLDLLLHLCRRQELPLLQVPLSTVTAQFLAYLEVMESLELDVASDFLDTAALLILLKSREMLPPPPAAEEEPVPDPRAELLGRLLATRRYREGARQIEALPWLDRDFFLRPAVAQGEVQGEAEAEVHFDAVDLLRALRDLLEAKRRRGTVHVAPKARRGVDDRIDHVLSVLASRGDVPFGELLPGPEVGWELWREACVVTLLALLELAHRGRLRLRQDGHLGPLQVSARDGGAAA
jgi:segregation and condensation protein A